MRRNLLTYMRLTGKRVGLIINFNVPALKDGILRRVSIALYHSPSSLLRVLRVSVVNSPPKGLP